MAGRFGPRRGRKWLVLAMALLVAAALVYVVADEGGASGPATLDLVALTTQGTFADTVDVAGSVADTLLPGDAAARFPLLLAVRNAGSRPASLSGLMLSVPARFRLTDGAGRPLPSSRDPGNPLVRYDLPVSDATIAPGEVPTVLEGLDTVWVEVVTPRWYCVAASDSVPEIVPAPPLPSGSLAEASVFYAFDGAGLTSRQTGLLTVRIEEGSLRMRAPSSPSRFEAEVHEPEAELPELTMLVEVGSTQARCGSPEDPLELLSTVWETPGGGRFIVLSYGGAPRKYLYDLNRDSIVELEAWDPDGDLDFEARRAADFPVPEFLLPETVVDLVLPWADTLRADTLPRERPWPGWVRLVQPVDTAEADTLGFDTLAVDSPAMRRPSGAQPRQPAAGEPTPERQEPTPVPQPRPASPDTTPAPAPQDTLTPEPPPEPEPRDPPPVIGRPAEPQDTLRVPD